MCCVKSLPVNFSGNFHRINIIVTLQNLCCLSTWLTSMEPHSPYWTLCQLWNFNLQPLVRTSKGEDIFYSKGPWYSQIRSVRISNFSCLAWLHKANDGCEEDTDSM